MALTMMTEPLEQDLVMQVEYDMDEQGVFLQDIRSVNPSNAGFQLL